MPSFYKHSHDLKFCSKAKQQVYIWILTEPALLEEIQSYNLFR